MFAACAYALLARSGAGVRPFIEAKKHIFKLIHTCVGEKQGRVAMRHKRRRRNHRVAFGRKKIEKRLADLVTAGIFT